MGFTHEANILFNFENDEPKQEPKLIVSLHMIHEDNHNMSLIKYYHNNCSQKRPNESSLMKMNYSYDYDRGTRWKLRSAEVFLSLCSGSLKAHTSKSRH